MRTRSGSGSAQQPPCHHRSIYVGQRWGGERASSSFFHFISPPDTFGQPALNDRAGFIPCGANFQIAAGDPPLPSTPSPLTLSLSLSPSCIMQQCEGGMAVAVAEETANDYCGKNVVVVVVVLRYREF